MGGIFRVVWPIILGLAMLMYPTTADSPGWWLGGISTDYPSAPSAWLIPDAPTPLRVKGDYRETNHFGPDVNYDATFLPDPPRIIIE